MTGLLVAYLLLFVFGAWMAIKVGRDSALMGILVFFVPFIGLLLVIKNWGSDNDLRVPALGWILAFGWYWHSAQGVADQALQGLDPATIAALQRGEELTPEQEAQLSQNMGGLLGIDPDAMPQGMDVDPIEFNQAALRINTIERKRGTVMLPEAKARLDVPMHFRFLEGAAVRAAMADSGEVFEPGFLGWVIHESVDLSKPEQWDWIIEVDAANDGHVKAEGLDASNQAALVERAKAAAARIAKLDVEGIHHNLFNGYRVAPVLDGANQTAAWVSDLAYADGTQALKCASIRLGRSAQVIYRLRAVADDAAELCLREVRLLASRTAFLAGQEYQQAGMLDGKSDFELAAYATDEALAEMIER